MICNFKITYLFLNLLTKPYLCQNEFRCLGILSADVLITLCIPGLGLISSSPLPWTFRDRTHGPLFRYTGDVGVEFGVVGVDITTVYCLLIVLNKFMSNFPHKSVFEHLMMSINIKLFCFCPLKTN